MAADQDDVGGPEQGGRHDRRQADGAIAKNHDSLADMDIGIGGAMKSG
jgi:hypothetical protein